MKIKSIRGKEPVVTFWKVMTIIFTILNFCVFLFLLQLFLFHVYLKCKGTTTFDFFYKSKKKKQLARFSKVSEQLPDQLDTGHSSQDKTESTERVNLVLSSRSKGGDKKQHLDDRNEILIGIEKEFTFGRKPNEEILKKRQNKLDSKASEDSDTPYRGKGRVKVTKRKVAKKPVKYNKLPKLNNP